MARNPDFDATLEAMKETHDRKNEDYAEGGNPYSNFEGAAFLTGTTVDTVFHTLIAIKMERLRQLVGGGRQPNNESVDDTILDLAVYATLWNSYRRRGQRGYFAPIDAVEMPKQASLWDAQAPLLLTDD